MKRDYSKCTDEQFDAILERLVGEMSTAQILAYGDVNAFFREELNNQVLEAWEQEHPPTLEELREQLIKDILCTAFEGGSAYWAEAQNVKREGPELDYVSFEFKDQEDDDDPWHPVNIEGIKLVFENLRQGKYEIRDELCTNLLEIYDDPENADYDADDADALVQLCAYGAIVFG